MNLSDYFNLSDVELTDLLDIALVAVLVYALLQVLRRTRSAFILGGMLALGALYLVAMSLGLRLTFFLFQMFFTVVLLAFIVIFRDEIRAFFERIAVWTFKRNRPWDARAKQFNADIESLVTVLSDFAREKIGALIVLPGRDEVARHLHGGVALNGDVSEPLLRSLFDPHSTGHDGAMLLHDGRVLRFGCHLPLSKDTAQLANRGTRHAAALGLAERTDAMCLVVSEERGVISVAHNGALTQVDNDASLRDALGEFLREIAPSKREPMLRRWVTRNIGLKAVSAVIAAALWFFVVHESVVEYDSYMVPVEHTGLAQGLKVAGSQPQRVRVIVSGPRRAFYFVNPSDFQVIVPLFDATPGTQQVFLTASDLRMPNSVTFANIFPREVTLTIERAAPTK